MDFSNSNLFKSCIQCGLCLPHCPTYQITKKEKHSPRGRLFYMKEASLNTELINAQFNQEMNYCLGCLSCEAHCPAGIPYSHFLEQSRHQSKKHFSFFAKIARRFLLLELFKSPWRLKLFSYGNNLLINNKVFQFFLKLLPSGFLKSTFEQFPKMSFQKLSTIANPAKPLLKIFIHPGCVQKFIFPQTNRATANVLRRNNCQTSCPEKTNCCGSLHAHNGELEMARQLARKNIDQSDWSQFDFIVSNAGGCGSHMKKYDKLFAPEDPYYQKAKQYSQRVRDIHELLAQIKLKPASSQNSPKKISFHDSCHLKHSQKITSEPREVISSVSHATILENSHQFDCCGAAGIYSISEADTAHFLSEKKYQDLNAASPDYILTSNPGCQLILQQRAQENRSKSPPIVHSIEFLEICYSENE